MIQVPFLVYAPILLRNVVAPVGSEVAILAQDAESEDGLGALQPPAGTGDVHAVLDEMPARALDDAGDDRPALLEDGGLEADFVSVSA